MTSLPPSDDAPRPKENQPSRPGSPADEAGLAPLIARALGIGPVLAPGRCGACGSGTSLVRMTHGEATRLMCLSCLLDSGPQPWHLPARFFAGLAMPVARAEERVPSTLDATTTCPGCGVTFADAGSTGLLGCPQCYEAFRAAIDPGLSRLHPVP